ncbi:MAG: hypothetical protein AB7E76_10475 [Deferribacterales bacterium]
MIKFSADEVDVLKEIVNISYGMATSLITNAAGSYVKLSVPEIIVTDINDIQNQLDKIPVNLKNCIVTNQKFKGAYIGESLFLVDMSSAQNFASLMLEEPADALDEEDIRSCALELSNILTSVSIGKLAELLSSHMSFSAPNLVDSHIDDIVFTYRNNSFEHFFIIKTWLSGQESDVVGYLLIFINEESFEYLQETIEKFIDENF